MQRMLLVASVLSVTSPTVLADPVDGLKPMAFLAEHCWKGQFANGKQTDEHCFKWLYDGKALRDTHTVRTPNRPDYIGETTYYWDSTAKQVAFLYIENLGGISRGTMTPAPGGALIFPATQYIEGGQALNYRSRWTVIDDKSYQARGEVQDKGEWTTMYDLTMKIQP